MISSVIVCSLIAGEEGILIKHISGRNHMGVLSGFREEEICFGSWVLGEAGIFIVCDTNSAWVLSL